LSGVANLVLASKSPRRSELLARLGLPFEVRASDLPEPIAPGFVPSSAVLLLGQLKATAVALGFPSACVIGSDSAVCLGSTILGKPKDENDARETLAQLSNRANEVVTGVAVIDTRSGETLTASVSTLVHFRAITSAEIEEYVATGEPMDKAGSYAIQGGAAKFIDSIEGCYNNVVGFPLCQVGLLLSSHGLEPATPQPWCLLPNGSPCPLSRSLS